MAADTGPRVLMRMKKISRILFCSAYLLTAALIGVSRSEESPSLQGTYDKHQSEILTTLTGALNSLSAYGAIFASGSARVLDDEDQEHAISVAKLEAESSVIDAFFEQVNWPNKIPTALRRELWNFYREKSNRFSLSRVETVDRIEDESSVVVIIGVRDSNISFSPPSYRDLVGMLSP